MTTEHMDETSFTDMYPSCQALASVRSVSPTPMDRSEEVRADTPVDGWMSRDFTGDREPKR